MNDNSSEFVEVKTRRGWVYLRQRAIVRVDAADKGYRKVYLVVGAEPVEVEETPEILQLLGVTS